MSNLKKSLSKFNKKERKALELLLTKIISLDWQGLSIKKLKGYKDVFRIRKGNIRIIFTRNQKNEIFIITIERRSEKTYKL
jgi:mRNA-degrading endonuclease RelE of RelBE toxin-antitoxin system